MKNSKLLTLSALTLVAACGLVSCGGQTHPKTKPEVYFYANSVTKDMSEESTRTVLTETGFKDEECAEVTVENGTDLKYGQEVVIYIKPKDGFTFRDYDTTYWTPIPTSAPIHPYVGLGNPYTLYNYPLPENVAWTFEDLSTPEGTTGFYNEKYKITVKKEFFKKNIVIDYGNTALNNNVFIYSSLEYKSKFKAALRNSDEQTEGNIQNYYKLDLDYSSFLAGSEGATVTYRFVNPNDLYTFKKEHWDVNAHSTLYTPPTPGNDDSKLFCYDNFSVLGIKGSETSPEKTEELALYDESVKKGERQKFIPSIINNKISFFIDWELLANITKDGFYNSLFDVVQVRLKKIGDEVKNEIEPDKLTEVNAAAENAGDVTIYPLGYSQHMLGSTPSLIQLSTSEIWTYKENANDPSSLFFERCDIERPLVSGKPAIDTNYGVLFKVADSKKTNQINITFTRNKEGGTPADPYYMNFTSDAAENPKTHWREEYYNDGTLKEHEEKELQYVSENGWHLVQLNPKERILFDETDYPELASEFNNGQNLYYLYSNDLDPFVYSDENGQYYYSTLDIKISISES